MRRGGRSGRPTRGRGTSSSRRSSSSNWPMPRLRRDHPDHALPVASGMRRATVADALRELQADLRPRTLGTSTGLPVCDVARSARRRGCTRAVDVSDSSGPARRPAELLTVEHDDAVVVVDQIELVDNRPPISATSFSLFSLRARLWSTLQVAIERRRACRFRAGAPRASRRRRCGLPRAFAVIIADSAQGRSRRSSRAERYADRQRDLARTRPVRESASRRRAGPSA